MCYFDPLTLQQTSSTSRDGILKADAVRIAIGKNVFYSDCALIYNFEDRTACITFRKTPKRATRSGIGPTVDDIVSYKIDLALDLQDVHFYHHKPDVEAEDYTVDECEVTHFVAIQARKSEENGLKPLSNAYDPDSSDLKRKFLVVEFRSETDFDNMLQTMKDTDVFDKKTLDKLMLTAPLAADYCQSLQDAGHSERQNRFSLTSPSIPMSDFLVGKKSDDVLLVYPFGGDPNTIDHAADGLQLYGENSDSDLIDHNSRDEKLGLSSEKENKTSGSDDLTSDISGEDSRSVLELAASTFERLEPGTYLNDTLIDFWCQW